MKYENQKAAVLSHLIELGPITPQIALKKYRCFRLAAVVYRLRRDGIRIDTELVKQAEGGEYAKYTLVAKGTREFTELVKSILDGAVKAGSGQDVEAQAV